VSFEPILLAPEEELEEIYPYRRVWRTSWIEVTLLLIAVLALYILTSILGLIPADSRQPALKVGIAGLPLALWLLISYQGERRALQPRPGLLGVMVLGMLVANGVAIPLEERVFVPERWLPAAGFFGRVLGYAFTIGFAAEFLKYAVLRYTAWPHRFQRRLDGMAYALAVSVGFASVLNFRVAIYTDATVVATALRVASTTFSHLAVGLIVAYFLVELAIGRPPIFWIASGLLFAALLSGLYFGFRGTAIVSGLSVEGTGSAPIRGLALAFGFVAIMFSSVAFVVQSADARTEAVTGGRQTL
jgi:RsiW-degrading membrane proteinase PrsW (M82 family)